MTFSFYFHCSTVGHWMLKSLLQSQHLRSILIISLQPTTQSSQFSLRFRSFGMQFISPKDRTCHHRSWWCHCKSTAQVLTIAQDDTVYPFQNKR